MHLLSGSPWAVILGTTTMGLAQGDTLLAITLTFESVPTSFEPNQHL